MIARADQRACSAGRSRRSRASPGCSPRRTRSATRSARRRPPPRSMIGVALVGLITIFGASARASVRVGDRPVDEGRLHRQLGRVRAGHDPADARDGSSRRRPERRAGRRGSQSVGEDQGLRSSSVHRGRPAAKSTRCSTSRPTRADLATLGADGHRGARQPTADDKNWKVGDAGAGRVPADRHAGRSPSRRSSTRPGFDPNYVISTDAFEANFPTVFDIQIYIQTEGRRRRRQNRAAIEKVDEAVPGAEAAGPRRVQGVAGRRRSTSS